MISDLRTSIKIKSIRTSAKSSGVFRKKNNTKTIFKKRRKLKCARKNKNILSLTILDLGYQICQYVK